MAKHVDTNHYHLWTDALHGRALAHQAGNKWDRATYARWTIVTAWIVLETACQDALDQPNISYRFRENLDNAVAAAQLQPVEWGQGVWQRVAALQKQRKEYVHRYADAHDLFPDTSAADRAIDVVRAAVRDIYQRAGKPAPAWIDDDDDRGWASGITVGMPTVGQSNPGVDQRAADTIRVVIIKDGEEAPVRWLAAGSDYMAYVEQMRSKLRGPVSGIRVYQGESILLEERLRMRGADDA